MSDWIKFDPKNNKTWPETFKNVLFIAPTIHYEPILGYLISYSSHAKIRIFYPTGLKEVDVNKIIAWQSLPEMPEKENA